MEEDRGIDIYLWAGRAAVLLVLAIAHPAAFPNSAGSQQPAHRNYSALSDDCTDCHELEADQDKYALTRSETINDSCGSCHFLYIHEYRPSRPGSEAAAKLRSNSLGSTIGIYEENFESKDSVGGHGLRRGDGSSTWPYSDKPSAAGLNCASCHAPHREDSPPQAAQACLKCHRRQSSSSGRSAESAPARNHPDQFCLYCHGDNLASWRRDFPHVGSPDLLIGDADSLCLGCHKKGRLP